MITAHTTAVCSEQKMSDVEYICRGERERSSQLLINSQQIVKPAVLDSAGAALRVQARPTGGRT